MKPQLRRKYKTHISHKDIEAIGIALSACSIGLVQYLHELEYAKRLATNPDYNGGYGGEILIPILILVVTVLISCEMERKQYAKYEKV